MELTELIKKKFEASKNKDQFIEELKSVLYELTPNRQPIDFVRHVSLDKIEANDYNPNSVASNEMNLLYLSISKDGYTQPVVTIHDKERDKYVIVDGFHRFTIMKNQKDIFDLNRGLLPIVVIEKDINDRMASTVRHNRARGKHSIDGMANMVFCMLEEGWPDDRICKELGMESEVLIRMKYITGFAKLFENVEYQRAWESKAQIKARMSYEEAQTTNS
jgi:hypothetical protein